MLELFFHHYAYDIEYTIFAELSQLNNFSYIDMCIIIGDNLTYGGYGILDIWNKKRTECVVATLLSNKSRSIETTKALEHIDFIRQRCTGGKCDKKKRSPVFVVKFGVAERRVRGQWLSTHKYILLMTIKFVIYRMLFTQCNPQNS